ncbi:hypothetical protein BC830DRAFT_1125167 [Chytriomyces sp. MP71]|nr:hypothetical protein BC830DRAFT_1125167 [Chytriomyces sp. MP71]
MLSYFVKLLVKQLTENGCKTLIPLDYFRSDVYHHFRVTPAPALKPGRAATSRLETPTKSRLLATFSRSAGYVGTADVVSQVERRTQNEQYEDSGSTSSKYGTPTGSDPMVTPKVGEILTQGKFEQESKRAGFGENLMVKQEGGGYQAITSQHMPSHYMPSQCTQSQYIPSQYIPRQYMSSQYIPSQHRQGQQQQILPDHHDRPKFTQRGQFRSSLTEDLHYHEGVPIAPSTGIAFRQSLLAIPKPPFQQQVSPLHLPQQGYAPQHATPQLLYNYPYPASSSTHYLPLPYHAMKEQQQHDHPGPIHYYTHTPDRHSMSPRHTTQCVSGHAPQTPCITAPTPTERQGMAEEEKGPAFVSHELAAMHTRAAFSF